MRERLKPRFRQGMGISLSEYSRNKSREFQTILMLLDGYIGYFDAWDETLRVFVFDNSDDADRAVKEAKYTGFESAGRIEGVLHISNADLERPHLKYIRKKSAFYAEYFR
ncbi:MAG: hypothetical protein IKE52_02520 [Mogibacterium sp.]|nr:hypothetical protein [Mogibacterium sp.]